MYQNVFKISFLYARETEGDGVDEGRGHQSACLPSPPPDTAVICQVTRLFNSIVGKCEWILFLFLKDAKFFCIYDHLICEVCFVLKAYPFRRLSAAS